MYKPSGFLSSVFYALYFFVVVVFQLDLSDCKSGGPSSKTTE